MFAFVMTIHVIACALLILIVLVQQGRGGGLVDSLSSAESIFGTKTNSFLIKSTSVLAVVFFITCLSLAFLSIQKNKSLIQTSYKPATTEEAKMPEKKAAQAQTSGTVAVQEKAPQATLPSAQTVQIPLNQTQEAGR